MSGFVSSPAPQVTPAGKMLACGPFWPDLDINHFRDTQRIGGTLIADPRVEMALQNAVLTADGDLGAWRGAAERAGAVRLADVPSAMIGGKARLALLWRQAIYALATAELIETHRDVTATGTGQSRGDALDDRAEDHRRTAIHAIRAIKGVKRTAVELI
ncbi:head completion/stabilization protein [Sphingopyxis yananensis]|uniref:head completion/stabilization protein n=1 Tax=Sphingopyxis yananensis TaxID=2886687 RepID=UPI001D1280FF|nr:head completion/stabilization protein [Sphingopyxis yananensis]MCC2602758.1 head completion/stabilization protein [Sphingopyxis yananensis]